MKKIALTILFSGVLLIAAGCGSSATESSDSSASGSASSKKVEITAVGSTALQPLVENIADIYQTDNPNYSIEVQGGGSGTGLSQVSTGAVEIGNSDIYAEEKDGIDAEALTDHQIAVVGIAPVANKEVGVTNLTSAQLVDIFTGKIKNWQEVGGKDQEILVVNRAAGSGTRATFEKWALDGQQPVSSQEQDSSGTVRKIVAETPGAISYLAFSYIDEGLLGLSVDDVKPTPENVADNSWKIWSYEHMYTAKDAPKEVTAFIEYILTDDVQKNVVEQLNYIPITSMKVERGLDGEVK
ncbi:phosphate ABC transporter substrate-binding protein PstS family protein [Vagococcus sp. BWB3-3]|uniref:Phosphate-binding protein n=1 Tax=Vagococcus allomyrinae TaxID=2794353 RepID=A0A940SZJ8_9ENTE|nr:phosphate ABC transporter substrate-binding protein PstS family protein [Vagococcus allomyrinae]MBP1044503.1 phosphate ABC transporter substrate-binding protein PstS family protein [Vagococcus allomyrinae]